MIELLLLCISLVMVAACGVFVAAEFSFIAVNRNTVQKLASRGDKRAQGVEHALQTLSTQLSGAQVGITITNLIIGFLAEPTIATLIRPTLIAAGVTESLVSPIAIGLGIAIATVITMLFGELIPKNFAIAQPLATAKYVQRLHLMFTRVMQGPIRILNGSANFALRKMGITPTEELASARNADELLSLVRRSAEKGTLPKETAVMLERSLNFSELTAIDVMTPRVQVTFIEASMSVQDVINIAITSGHSRFPVIGEDTDDILGTIHVKQAMGVSRAKRSETPITTIMQKPVLVPSSMQLESLLDSLRSNRVHMGIVIDEFGGVDGIVTMEDLLEELVGEVHDEHDNSTRSITPKGKRIWDISGLLRPDEIAEELDVFLPDDEEFETVAGLFMQTLGKMPKLHDTVQVTAVDRDGRRLVVELRALRLDGYRLDTIRLSILKHQDRAS